MPLESTNPPWARKVLLLAAFVAMTLDGPASADDPPLRLQGLFCNSEDQIDRTLAHIGRGLAPQLAVELANREAVVCTYVDLLRYVVSHPVSIGENRSFVAPVKYKATLVGVIVGDELRAISPPVQVFFVTPERIAGAAMERRT